VVRRKGTSAVARSTVSVTSPVKGFSLTSLRTTAKEPSSNCATTRLETDVPPDGDEHDTAVRRRSRQQLAAGRIGDVDEGRAAEVSVRERRGRDEAFRHYGAVREAYGPDGAVGAEADDVGPMLVAEQGLNRASLQGRLAGGRDLGAAQQRPHLQQDESEYPEDAGDDRHATATHRPRGGPVSTEPPRSGLWGERRLARCRFLPEGQKEAPESGPSLRGSDFRHGDGGPLSLPMS
jgi:hypothetical protein